MLRNFTRVILLTMRHECEQACGCWRKQQNNYFVNSRVLSVIQKALCVLEIRQVVDEGPQGGHPALPVSV